MAAPLAVDDLILASSSTELPPIDVNLSTPMGLVSAAGTATHRASQTTSTSSTVRSHQSLSAITGFHPLRLDVQTPSTVRSMSAEHMEGENPFGLVVGLGASSYHPLTSAAGPQETSCEWSAAPTDAAPEPLTDRRRPGERQDGDEVDPPSCRARTATPHKLGHGASGNVSLMRQGGAGSRYVAVKRLKVGGDFKLMERRETAFAHRYLRRFGVSPTTADVVGLIQILGTFRPADGSVRVVLEFMDYGHIMRFAPLPASIIAAVARQLLCGLRTLHEDLRTIHRDLKPENVLVNSQGHVKLADFGVAALLGDDEVAALDQAGTILQMSPERLRGDAHGPASDVWSLGIAIAHLALGRHPFVMDGAKPSESSEDNFWRMVELLQATSPHERCDNATRIAVWGAVEPCEPSVRDFVLRCCDAKPQQRATVTELESDPLVAQLTVPAAIETMRDYLAENCAAFWLQAESLQQFAPAAIEIGGGGDDSLFHLGDSVNPPASPHVA